MFFSKYLKDKIKFYLGKWWYVLGVISNYSWNGIDIQFVVAVLIVSDVEPLIWNDWSLFLSSFWTFRILWRYFYDHFLSLNFSENMSFFSARLNWILMARTAILFHFSVIATKKHKAHLLPSLVLVLSNWEQIQNRKQSFSFSKYIMLYQALSNLMWRNHRNFSIIYRKYNHDKFIV